MPGRSPGSYQGGEDGVDSEVWQVDFIRTWFYAAQFPGCYFSRPRRGYKEEIKVPFLKEYTPLWTNCNQERKYFQYY